VCEQNSEFGIETEAKVYSGKGGGREVFRAPLRFRIGCPLGVAASIQAAEF